MYDLFHKRLLLVERDLASQIAAPTFPIYDVSDLPQDAIKGQIAIGSDNSINWFNGSWQTQAGTLSIVGNVPQDAVNGQLVIGLDNSLNWFVNDSWYGVAGAIATGNPPQDAIDGQIVLGSATPVWHHNGQWYGISVSTVAASFVYSSGFFQLSTDTDYLIEFHYVSGSPDQAFFYVDGSLVLTRTFVHSGNAYQGITIEMFPDGGHPGTFPNLIYYLRNLKIGFTRNGSDLWSDSFSSVPTDPPYDTVINPVDSGQTGLTIETISGNNYLKVMCVDQGGQHVFVSLDTAVLGFNFDVWTTFTFRIPPSTVLSLVNDILDDTVVIGSNSVDEYVLVA